MPSVASYRMVLAFPRTYRLGIALLLTLGCAEQISGNPFNDSVTECRVDNDCYSNESCLVGQCVNTSSTSIDLSYIVEPNPVEARVTSDHLRSSCSTNDLTERGADASKENDSKTGVFDSLQIVV